MSCSLKNKKQQQKNSHDFHGNLQMIGNRIIKFATNYGYCYPVGHTYQKIRKVSPLFNSYETASTLNFLELKERVHIHCSIIYRLTNPNDIYEKHTGRCDSPFPGFWVGYFVLLFIFSSGLVFSESSHSFQRFRVQDVDLRKGKNKYRAK